MAFSCQKLAERNKTEELGVTMVWIMAVRVDGDKRKTKQNRKADASERDEIK